MYFRFVAQARTTDLVALHAAVFYNYSRKINGSAESAPSSACVDPYLPREMVVRDIISVNSAIAPETFGTKKKTEIESFWLETKNAYSVSGQVRSLT